MDIRNIEIPEELKKSAPSLDLLYSLAKDQLEGYKEIEGLPEYPLDINPSKSQIILKDFIGRVIEELAEGYESTSAICEICNKYGWNINLMSTDEYVDVLNNLQNANEEQADAIGFFLTLLIYSNILPEDLVDYVKSRVVPNPKLTDFEMILAFGINLLKESTPFHTIGYNLLNKTIYEEFTGKEEKDYYEVYSYSPGFQSMSYSDHENEAPQLWKVTYQLNLTRNLLKNRPWKRTHVMTKEIDYQESLVLSFIMYLGFLGLHGFVPNTIQNLFIRKQQLNKWRQRTNY